MKYKIPTTTIKEVELDENSLFILVKAFFKWCRDETLYIKDIDELKTWCSYFMEFLDETRVKEK